MSPRIGATDRFQPPVRIAAEPAACARALAEFVVDVASRAVVARGGFSLAFSGGTTPTLFFQTLRLAPYRNSVEWTRAILFLVDERLVPADNPASNYRLVKENFLDGGPARESAVYRWKTELGTDAALADYEAGLSSLPHAGSDPPELDLLVLGLGPDGHTASLFPGTAPLEETTRWVAAGRAPQPPVDRLTMTYPLINAARHAAFLVNGTEKASLVAQILSGEGKNYPAAAVRPRGGPALWFLDSAAARDLSK